MTNAIISIARTWEHKLLYFESGLCMSIFWGFTPDLTSGVKSSWGVGTYSLQKNIYVKWKCEPGLFSYCSFLFSFADTEAQKRESTVLTLFMSCRRYRRGDGQRGRDRLGEISPKNQSPLLHSSIYFRQKPNEDFCGLSLTSTFPSPTPYVTVYSLKSPSRRFSAPPSLHTSPLPIFLVRIPPSAKQISPPVMKNLLYLAAS